MNEDLKIIKKKYGEKMAHLCREFFPTILETEGLFLKLMLEHFEPSHDLYEDIISQNRDDEFKNYIYSLVDVEDNFKEKVIKTPKELLNKAGYDLYECKCEEDIQKFKKYYAPGEEICTFHGGRLDRCHVFFAVKKNVSHIKREDFSSPQRQDEYGTSVISIQFTRDKSHTLSIKNRYNHTVNNPDSTYSNNLDNIIPGLTESFAEHYDLEQQHKTNGFELRGYIKARDGKYYKCNQEINNIYYCPNNIIIDNFEVKRYDKEKYIILDYFILDLVKKEIRLYDENIPDPFPSTIINIAKIEIERKEDDTKEIKITLMNNNEVNIILNKDNQILKLNYPNLEYVGNGFLCNAKALKILKMVDLQKVGNGFLYHNATLEELELPLLEEVADNFLLCNRMMTKLNLPNLQRVGSNFLNFNEALIKLNLPKLLKIDNGFLLRNCNLEKLDLPLLEVVGNDFLYDNSSLKKLFLPNLKIVGYGFLYFNNSLVEINCPLLRKVGDNFCWRNLPVKKINMPNLEEVGDNFLSHNTSLQELDLPKLRKARNYFMDWNECLKIVNLPSLEEVGYNFLKCHPTFTREDFIAKIKR